MNVLEEFFSKVDVSTTIIGFLWSTITGILIAGYFYFQDRKHQKYDGLIQRIRELEYQIQVKHLEIQSQDIDIILKKQLEMSRQQLEKTLEFRKRDLNAFDSSMKMLLESLEQYGLLSKITPKSKIKKEDKLNVKNDVRYSIGIWLNALKGIRISIPPLDTIYSVVEPILQKFSSELLNEKLIHKESIILGMISRIEMIQSTRKFIENEIAELTKKLQNFDN